VIGIRRSDGSLKAAVDDALRAMSQSGDLRKILERWHLWDARQGALQGRLSTSEPPPAEAAASGTTAARSWSFADTRLFVQGAAVTVLLSIAAFTLALPVGLALALGRLERRRAIRYAATAYVELFRGTPLLLQLYVLYFGLAPVVRLGALSAAIIGLSLNYSAYEAEIHRGALLAVPKGQGKPRAPSGSGAGTCSGTCCCRSRCASRSPR